MTTTRADTLRPAWLNRTTYPPAGSSPSHTVCQPAPLEPTARANDLAAADVVDRQQGRIRARQAKTHRERTRHRVCRPESEARLAGVDASRGLDRERVAH